MALAVGFTSPLVFSTKPLLPGIPNKSILRLSSSSRSLLLRPLLCSTTTTTAQPQDTDLSKKLYVSNLPWTLSDAELEALFSDCGSVAEVEVVKQRNGRSRGFAFVTMGSPQEAQAAIDKLDSHKLLERIIRVEYAKNSKKPGPPPSPTSRDSIQETKNLIYASNLAWKLRSNHLREFFSASFKPVSAKVVFDSSSGKAAGYGFVSFATKEEAEAAVAELDGKELMGRPLYLKISEKKDDEADSEPVVEDNTILQAEEALSKSA